MARATAASNLLSPLTGPENRPGLIHLRIRELRYGTIPATTRIFTRRGWLNRRFLFSRTGGGKEHRAKENSAPSHDSKARAQCCRPIDRHIQSARNDVWTTTPELTASTPYNKP